MLKNKIKTNVTLAAEALNVGTCSLASFVPKAGFIIFL
jgi:hypothetical protein